jgi:hypothetical protein
LIYDFAHSKDTQGKLQRRAEARRPVVKTAVLVTGDAVVDCMVLDLSTSGARVRLCDAADIPEDVTLKLTGGSRYCATRRWADDREMGFSITEPPFDLDTREKMAWRVYEDVRLHSIRRSIGLMKALDFFGDPAMRTQAEQVEEGLRRLETEFAHRARLD